MGFVKGGLEAVSISDGSTVVTSENVHEDYEYSEEPQTTGLADGQQANASKDVMADLFLLDLSSSDASQLRTWEDNETKVYATFQGADYTAHWADETYASVEEERAGRGELSGTHIRLTIER